MSQQIRYFKRDGTEYDFSKNPEMRITKTSNADMNIGIPKTNNIEQQTAVGWLVRQLSNEFISEVFLHRWSEVSHLVDKAKQMEKEQMIRFYKWMKENDTFENAEKYFHYSDEDMLNEFKQNK